MPEVPLHAEHISLGAKMGPFGGWDMPIEYTAGTVAEHTAVRTAVGIFDVSHMGKLRITGSGARDFVNSIVTNDLARISEGQAQYSMLCNESGGIVDDLIVYLVNDDEVRIIPNAGNATTIFEALRDAAPTNITVTNNHLTQGIIAVQGPRSADVLDALGLPTDHEYMAFVDATWNGHPLTVCRTGYTGEHGYEIVVGNEALVSLWNELLTRGEQFAILPCGLGARDTLRTEMGYPLHGQDISPSISPVEARTGWAVGWNKETFAGKDALVTQKQVGATRSAWGLLAVGRGIPRSHMQVRTSDGDVVGETTSGTFSPTLQVGIALALLSPSVAEGDELIVDVRGRDLAVRVTKPPFVPAHTK
ncbi:MAG: glycine cleavage system aminomethyltransferase GcvT [Actinomycetes bacterium]